MKTYSFKLNKTNKKQNNSNFRNNNYSKIIDDIIFNNMISANDWMKDLFTKKNSHITFKATKSTNLSDYEKFLEAYKYLLNYSDNKDIQDFELQDGTPVKIFDDEIQIGFDLIPKTKDYTINLFNQLKPTTKKIFIDIYVDLNK